MNLNTNWTNSFGRNLSKAPVVDATSVYAYVSGKLSISNLSDGKLAYEIADSDFSSASDSMTSLLLTDNQKIIVSRAGRLSTYDLASRTKSWSLDASSSPEIAYGK